jgi:hypothetical protein
MYAGMGMTTGCPIKIKLIIKEYARHVEENVTKRIEGAHHEHGKNAKGIMGKCVNWIRNSY